MSYNGENSMVGCGLSPNYKDDWEYEETETKHCAECSNTLDLTEDDVCTECLEHYHAHGNFNRNK
jgi:hypothetical protein